MGNSTSVVKGAPHAGGHKTVPSTHQRNPGQHQSRPGSQVTVRTPNVFRRFWDQHGHGIHGQPQYRGHNNIH